MIFLGIETSCDETSVALVDDQRRVLAQQTRSQLDEHLRFGGVVPEIAARAHLLYLPRMVEAVMREAGMGWDRINGIAATIGPGLMGGLLVGAIYGRSLALARGIPFHPVNHLEGHALTARLTDDIEFPYLLLLVSGGHTALINVRGVGDYQMLGETRDDAAGECFDKCAKLLGLGWPGGPALEKLAAQSTGQFKFDLPHPMKHHASADFSFSGLKTAVRQIVRGNDFKDEMRADLAAAVQTTIAKTIAERTERALKIVDKDFIEMVGTGNASSEQKKRSRYFSALVAAGGVAANGELRSRLMRLVQLHKTMQFIAPPIALCTDNAAMIAWAAIERARANIAYPANAAPRPRWPLAA